MTTMNSESNLENEVVLAQQAVALAEKWIHEAESLKGDSFEDYLHSLLSDENGVEFLGTLIDGVARPEDPHVIAKNLRAAVERLPRNLRWQHRMILRAGSKASWIFPKLVSSIARRVIRRMVRHLVIDASPRRLSRSIRHIQTQHPGSVKLNFNVLGEAILGKREADRRIKTIRRILQRSDVDYVSLKVSAITAPHSHWAFEQSIADIVTKLAPLYRVALRSRTAKFLNLDMEEYRDLRLTVRVFKTILSRPEFHRLYAGIVVQAYLPDALAVVEDLEVWSAERVRNGGAPIKIRLVKGANLPMERVEAEQKNWPLATWPTKAHTDANYKLILRTLMRQNRMSGMRLGIAGHNMFDIAYSWLLAEAAGLMDRIDYEMLLGMASRQAQLMAAKKGSIILYTPIVQRREFEVAIAYLARRLDEIAASGNYMSAVTSIATDRSVFERERERFLNAIVLIDRLPQGSHRQQNRMLSQDGVYDTSTFQNTADTDPDLPRNSRWIQEILAAMSETDAGNETVERHTIAYSDTLYKVVERANRASEGWRNLSAEKRANILHQAGVELERRRAELLTIMGHECGKTLDQGDPEVSEAVDFAHYYAEEATRLEAVEGARVVPHRVTVVTPPWNFPVAIPAGSTLAALAAGSSVILKAAKQARRSGAVMAEALWAAGVPNDVLQYVQLENPNLGEELITHPAVNQVILTGGYETAERFYQFRPELKLHAETSGKNAIIVTPSADYELAVRDIVNSAFGHAGQKCSAASLVILVGSVKQSKRFRSLLLDATRSLRVGMPNDPATQMGPLMSVANGKLLWGLTKLGQGERWLLKPKPLGAGGKLWSPGIREGVRPGSEFHHTEYFGPILGVMTAATLTEAVDLANAVDYGLTSGIHSLDFTEIQYWIQHIHAGNLYVNRSITGAIVRRQPFGGWKKSVVGTTAKAGGPNYVSSLAGWRDAPPTVVNIPEGLSDNLENLTRKIMNVAQRCGLSAGELNWLSNALRLDVLAWHKHYQLQQDMTGMQSEINMLRYLPADTVIRYENGQLVKLFRTAAAGIRAAGSVKVSFRKEIPSELEQLLLSEGSSVIQESDQQFADRVFNSPTGSRVRLLADRLTSEILPPALRGQVTIYDQAVVSSGEIEMLPYLLEQSVSVTAHRFGNPTPLTRQLRNFLLNP